MMAFSKKKCCQYHSPFQIKKWKFSRWIPNTHKMKLKRFLESKWWEGITISHRFHHSNQVRPLLHSLRSRRISPCATWKASSLCPTSLARDHSTAGMTFSGKRMNNTDYFLQGGLPPTWCTWLLRLVKKIYMKKMEGFFQGWSKSRVGILSKGPVAMQRQAGPQCQWSLWHPGCVAHRSKILRRKKKTRRRMARERRGAGSSLVSLETPYYKTIY